MSDAQDFSSIANISLASSARILRSSWCPDKDLLVLIVRISSKDRLSLWKMQGSKIWEVDIDMDAVEGSSSAETSIVDVAWSPDNLYIAVAHHPPLVTLHSIQDGREERRLGVSAGEHALERIWWFKELRAEKKPGIPDVFKRQNVITGSAHSILKTQPLLDALPDESERLSATDLFAFQSIRKTTHTSSLPHSISSWPTLPSDPLLASIQPRSLVSSKTKRPGEELDEVDDSNVNSVLFASTLSKGGAGPKVFAWLDGSYPLGSVTLPHPTHSVTEFHKIDNKTYIVQPRFTPSLTTPDAQPETALTLAKLSLPTLPRDVAQTASSARALVWYTLRLVKEMREAWFGNAAHKGAREIGPNWVRTLERKQVTNFGVEEVNAVLDLTALLATGRASDSLTDYLGSGDQMTERGLLKWETIVSEALLKLRDYSSRRVAPACQRIHVLLQEVQGWAQLSQYAECHFNLADINVALDLAARAVMCSNWLAATARKEVQRFKEFIAWIKYESQRAANLNNETYTPPPPRHDILDVNAYLTSGLVVSTIDKWFMGPVPQFPLTTGLTVPHSALAQPLSLPERLDGPKDGWTISAADEENKTTNASKTMSRLDEVLKRARRKLDEGKGAFVWPPDARPYDLSSLDRNLDALVQDLAARCGSIFREASGAVSSAASVSGFPASKESTSSAKVKVEWMRERCAVEEGKGVVQHLAMGIPPSESEEKRFILLVKTSHDLVSGQGEPGVTCAVLECVVEEQNEDGSGMPIPIEVLDADYFDDELLVLVYRAQDDDKGPTKIATVQYADLEYKEFQWDRQVKTREGLVDEVVRRIARGSMASIPLSVRQQRPLAGCSEGSVVLAVNGRAGRRVACVLSEEGMSLEVFDMEGDDEDDEAGDDE